MEMSLELVLGIIGSVTGMMGAASLFIHVLRYLKEKPKIEPELIDAKHYYAAQGEKKRDYYLGFLIPTRVRNKGDRATTIGEVTLDFTIGKHDYRITQDNIVLSDGSKVRVGPNDIIKVEPTLGFRSSYDKVPKQEEIPFKLTFHHAHGIIELEGTSNIEPEG